MAKPAAPNPIKPPIQVVAVNREMPLPNDAEGTRSVTSADPTALLVCIKTDKREIERQKCHKDAETDNISKLTMPAR